MLIMENIRIGGFSKQSFIDWDGRLSAVIFTKGCNFRCGYCHNPSLVLSHEINRVPDYKIDEILKYLSSRKQWLDGVVITGGEPTLHKALPDFIKAIKENGYEIKLDTNGSNPAMLDELIKNELLDFVAMDIKTLCEPDKYMEITHLKDEALITKIKQSVEILRSSGIKYQLRTTVIPKHHTRVILDQLRCQFEKEYYVLQDFRNGDILANYTEF